MCGMWPCYMLGGMQVRMLGLLVNFGVELRLQVCGEGVVGSAWSDCASRTILQEDGRFVVLPGVWSGRGKL